MISLKVDTSKVEAKLKGMEAKAKDVVQKDLDTLALKTVNDAKRLAPVDEGFLRNSISFNSAPLKAEIIVAANYAAYVEFGTRSFAAQYVATLPANWQSYAAIFKGKAGGNFDDFVLRLVEWVKKKGLHRLSAIHDAQTGQRFYKKARKSYAQKEEDADKIAYAIAIKIMREGVEPQPFLFPAVQKNLIELKKRLN